MGPWCAGEAGCGPVDDGGEVGGEFVDGVVLAVVGHVPVDGGFLAVCDPLECGFEDVLACWVAFDVVGPFVVACVGGFGVFGFGEGDEGSGVDGVA